MALIRAIGAHVLNPAVDPLHERVFKRHPAARHLEVVYNVPHQLLKRVNPCRRNELLPQGLVGCVEGDGQRGLQFVLREFGQRGVDANSGDCNASASNAELLVDDVDCLNDSVYVQERLAHAHEHCTMAPFEQFWILQSGASNQGYTTSSTVIFRYLCSLLVMNKVWHLDMSQIKLH
jgi:hypothetical protein